MLHKDGSLEESGGHKHASCEDASDRQPSPIGYAEGCCIVKFGSLSGTSKQPRSAPWTATHDPWADSLIAS